MVRQRPYTRGPHKKMGRVHKWKLEQRVMCVKRSSREMRGQKQKKMQLRNYNVEIWYKKVDMEFKSQNETGAKMSGVQSWKLIRGS